MDSPLIQRARRMAGTSNPRRPAAAGWPPRGGRPILAAPARRNRVWQVDFTHFETAGGGTWRILGVVDYATKLCLGAPISGTSAGRDAVEGLQIAIGEAERLLGRPLAEDCMDPASGELTPLTIVSDNGPAFKSLEFVRFIAGRPELAHVRTRHRAPETNGVVERFFQTLKYEQLYRVEIGDVLALQTEVDAFRQLYHTWRPHEALGFRVPLAHYLAEPTSEPNLSAPESVQIS